MFTTRKWWLLLVAALLPLSAHADGLLSNKFTAAAAGTSINNIGTAIGFHKITWNVSGTASVCTVALDTSADGVSWSAGGAIAGQTCTSNGTSTVATVVANYVRINMTALTVTAGSSVIVTWTGYVNNPAGSGGTVTTSGSPLANEMAVFTSSTAIGPNSPCPLLQPTLNPTAGQVLSSAAPSGGTCQLSWASGGAGTIGGTAANTDVSFGSGVNTITTNSGFTFTTGTGALSIPNNSPYQIGGATILAAPNSNTDTVVGLGAGAAISTNQNTTFVGLDAGQHLAAGNNNTAMGSFAMEATSTANSENVAVGSAALENVTSNDNVAVGYNAMLASTNSQGNTAVGAGAMAGASQVGNFNTAIGYQSGIVLTTGLRNILIGQTSTGTEITSGNDNILIASNSSVLTPTANGQLDLGDVLLGTGITTPATAALSVTNSFSAKAYLTATNCAANGSAANPSIVACSAASAGMFSCATAASTGTCQVNTTAVTANSEITITQDAADGGAGQLNVTCNTGNVLSATAPVLASKNSGVSFTINLGTVTTNPACFEYTIKN